MPPPNITGKLHLGHSIFLSIQDALTRYYRKSGYSTLWLPRTDHAGITTHNKIIESFDSYIPSQSEYFERASKIKDINQNKIIEQIKKMGASCDWSRLNYTMDDKFKIAATQALKNLHSLNLLYKKEEQWYISMKGMADDLLFHIRQNYFIINDQTEMNKLIYTLENIEDWCINEQTSIRSQMKKVDKSNADYSIILGSQEIQDNTFTIKDLKIGQQQTLDFQSLINYLKN